MCTLTDYVSIKNPLLFSQAFIDILGRKSIFKMKLKMEVRMKSLDSYDNIKC